VPSSRHRRARKERPSGADRRRRARRRRRRPSRTASPTVDGRARSLLNVRRQSGHQHGRSRRGGP
jgi:hypothetical protein